MNIFDFILHIDQYLTDFISNYGSLTYLIIFGIIFIETGLVIMPFLPGDSILFAAGALANTTELNIVVLLVVTIIAAILGDTVNFAIGRKFGHLIHHDGKTRFIKPSHWQQADDFIVKYGTISVFYARFVPIVRTIVPFVVGMSDLKYSKFLKFNIIGGIVWTTSFLLLGYFFGGIPFVEKHFELIILSIIFVSIVPVFVKIGMEYFKNKKKEGL